MQHLCIIELSYKSAPKMSPPPPPPPPMDDEFGIIISINCRDRHRCAGEHWPQVAEFLGHGDGKEARLPKVFAQVFEDQHKVSAPGAETNTASWLIPMSR